MDLKLVGKRALVTGSSSGIGKAIAAALAAEGALVVVHGRDRTRVEATAFEIARSGGAAPIAVGDLATDDAPPLWPARASPRSAASTFS
jgi:3-oxoacyl-[acyl-carrier protein] reductase